MRLVSVAAALSVAIGPGVPLPDPEDSNVLGVRSWSVATRVVVHFGRACATADYRSSGRAFFNGRPYARGAQAGASSRFLPARRAGGIAVVSDGVSADAGTVVRMRVRVRCGGATATATRTFRLPAVSCDGGPLHVYELGGHVRREDDNFEARWVPVRAGELVAPDATLRIARGGRALVGATECNGFRVSLGPGEYSIGSYVQTGRGVDFAGRAAVAHGDAHGGGLAAHGLRVLPLSTRCRGCGDPAPASYEMRTVGGIARVRVYDGAVVASAFNGRSARVRQGQQAAAVCASDTRCRLIGPRVFQPAEPWTTPPASGRARFARRLAVSPGSRPPPRLLAPPFSVVRSLVGLPAAGGEPAELLVHWTRARRMRPGPGELQEQQGIALWRRASPSEWRLAWMRRYSGYLPLGALSGDVNGDRHPDVLLVEWNGGTGFCGPRRLIADVRGRAHELFARTTCETEMRIAGGALHIDEPVGPCPYRNGSVHCFGGTRHVVLRWRGERLVERRARVRCALARLDPARGCRPRR